jgi:hypothetical protein
LWIVLLPDWRTTPWQARLRGRPNYELGAEVHGKGVQLGLNFADITPELFAGQEMGEDALRVLNDYRKVHARIRADIKAELPPIRAAVAWSKRV